MKFPKYILSFLVLSYSSIAQEGFTEKYHFNYLSINPAFAGETGPFGVKAITENQFTGNFRLNKLSQIIALDGQLYGNAGLAFQGYRINSGNVLSSGLNLSYSKGFEFDQLKLKLGVETGLVIQPNILSSQLNQNVAKHVGPGILTSFKGIYAGFSRPFAWVSKNSFVPKTNFYQVGYFLNDVESPYQLNVSIVARSYADIFTTDINARLGLKNKLSFYASARQDAYKKWQVVPAVFFQVSKSTQLGAGYSKNEFLNGVTQTAIDGHFQIFLRYISKHENSDSWFGPNF